MTEQLKNLQPTMIEQFKAARRVGTPLIVLETADQVATVTALKEATPKTSPMIQWDAINGWKPVNDNGGMAIRTAMKGEDVGITVNVIEMLARAQALPEKTVLLMHNSQRWLADHVSPAAAQVVQGMSNLRDQFKGNFRTLVLLGPRVSLPPELSQDVLPLDEPLPDEAVLRTIVTETVDSAEDLKNKPKPDAIERAVDALRGLPSFAAEQVTAMSLTKEGLDLNGMWERKRKMIEMTPGLTVYRGTEKFKDIGGCDQIKEFLRGIIDGNESPRVIVFMDEGEKMFAGATGEAQDSSGVSQDFLGAQLSYMEDTEADGAIFLGPPGAAKSFVAKAVGNEAGVPTIRLDLGAMKGSLVGESEQRLRTALKVITAVGGGRAFFIMTCNKLVALPPELRRRYTSGIWFFDLPDREERDAIWPLYINKWKLDSKQREAVQDHNYTGAEIRNCCRTAFRQRRTLADAARFIVPVAVSGAAEIEGLRKQADRKYLSASRPGLYEYTESAEAPAPVESVVKRSRRVSLNSDSQ
jgi:hypothetical protein